jgi:hypothetical protein
MPHRPLRLALSAFAEECAAQLAADAADGAEVPFELVRAGRRDAPLYCYRPMVGRYLAGRIGVLGRLESYPRAAHALAACGGLDDYLAARGEAPRGTPRQRVDAALLAFVARVFEDSTDFELLRGRLEAACQELEAILLDGRAETAVVVPVLGLTIDSPEVVLADGLALARGDTFDGEAPPEALWADGAGEPHVLAVLRWELAPGDPAPLAHARVRLARLRTALRLFDPAGVTLSQLAWTRTAAGPWQPFALGPTAVRGDGVVHVAPEQEDELRAFCNLVGRRTPRSGPVAWALRRWELGNERAGRAGMAQALADHLLALRALLEPEGPQSGRLAERLAVLCAMPGGREALSSRVTQAAALERSVVAGAGADEALGVLVGELSGYLRALLRDVLCGHLECDLSVVADALLAREAATPTVT